MSRARHDTDAKRLRALRDASDEAGDAALGDLCRLALGGSSEALAAVRAARPLECSICGGWCAEVCEQHTGPCCHVSVSWEDCVSGNYTRRVRREGGLS